MSAPSPFTAVAAGLLFGSGLVLSGMADPGKVLAFLQLGAGWDASLMFVMGAALAVTVPGFAWLRRRGCVEVSTTAGIDARLLGGAAIFGLGWGLAGYCPGPALVAFSQLAPSALWFVPAMLAGQWLADRLPKP